MKQVELIQMEKEETCLCYAAPCAIGMECLTKRETRAWEDDFSYRSIQLYANEAKEYFFYFSLLCTAAI